MVMAGASGVLCRRTVRARGPSRACRPRHDVARWLARRIGEGEFGNGRDFHSGHSGAPHVPRVIVPGPVAASAAISNPRRNGVQCPLDAYCEETPLLRGYIIIETAGRKVPVEESLVIGRTADSGLMIEDNAASRRHMEIKARPDRFIWKDLGSTNGTLVNGAKMLAGELKNGDTIQIGETTLRFEVHGRAEPARPAESGGGTGEESRLFTETIMDAHGQVQKQEAPNKTTKLLEAVYSVANEIATNYEPCSLMDGVPHRPSRRLTRSGGHLSGGSAVKLLPCPHCGAVHSIANGKLQQARIGDIRSAARWPPGSFATGERALSGHGQRHGVERVRKYYVLAVAIDHLRPVARQTRHSGHSVYRL